METDSIHFKKRDSGADEMSVERSCPWTPEIQQLQKNGLLRTMPMSSGIPGRVTIVNGREVINFSSNNYLGLAGHPDVMQAASRSTLRYGAGSTASRLIAGNSEIHRQLELFIARWKSTEAALVFGSGYQANVGVLSALFAQGDLIVSDALNHASIIDGCRLSRAEVRIYPHRDLNRVEDLVKSGRYRRKLVVTESVFSMDGDQAPLKDLDAICRRWNAILMVDEAHATGVLGIEGRGLASALNVVPEIQMGTLGKAVGASGAYVAGPRALIDLLINKARSLIYTTAPPPAVMGSALAALNIIASNEGNERRLRLQENIALFNKLLNTSPWAGAGSSHIVPVVIGDSEKTMQISARCLSKGVFAHGIRFPTVPDGTARLRFTLMSDHTSEDLQKAVDVLMAASEDVWSLPEGRSSRGKMFLHTSTASGGQ